jgi:hypothetical protein
MADDELALRRAADRAAKARVILDSDLFNEAWTELEASYIEAWKATSARDTDGRERLWLANTVLHKVKGQFETMLTDGKVAMITLNEIDAEQQRQKRT